MKNNNKKNKEENIFFTNCQTGRINYNETCKRCGKDCKQSFRSKIMNCKDYIGRGQQ